MRAKEKAPVRAKEGAVVRTKQEIVAVGQEAAVRAKEGAAVRAIPLYPHWVLGADDQQFLRERAGQGRASGSEVTATHPQGQ